MKSPTSILALCLLSLIFFQCSNSHFKHSSLNKFYPVVKAVPDFDDDEDGIKDAQEMEFNNTKDIALGYIPKDRLAKATKELVMARRSGTANFRVLGLSWMERGPYIDLNYSGNGRSAANPAVSGRLRAICVDLNDATNNTVWVGSAGGGLWKTSNISATPATWVPVNDFFANLAVTAICQDPLNKNNLYFATGEPNYNADAVKGGGIFKSSDSGATWALLSGTSSFGNATKIICDASGYIYIATVGGAAGIQRSKDLGSTWQDITPTNSTGTVYDINISSTGKLHIAYSYKSGSPASSGYNFTPNPATVTPATWVTPTTVYTNNRNNTTLASKGDTLYALPGNNSSQTDQVWKSVDGGANWLTTGTTPPISGNTPLSSGQSWYCEGLAVDPSNSKNVMVGGLNTYISSDGGDNWAPNSVWVYGIPGSANYMHADHHVFNWSNGGQLLCGSDGGLFYSSDGGATFTDRNQGLRTLQFYSCALHPTSPNYFLAGAQDNGVLKLNGSGLAGGLEVVGGDGGFVHIDENEPQYQFGSYVYNQYSRSTDSGASYSSKNFSNSAGQFINPTDYDDINNNFYGAWTAGNYMRWINAPLTDNYYATSVSAFSGGTVTHVHSSKYTPNRVLFGVNNGKIVLTDNANTASPSATNISGTGMPASTVSCIAMGTNENNLIATFSNYGAAHVWLSTVGGGASGWTNVTGNLPDIPVRWCIFNPENNTKAIIATDMGIFETTLLNGASTSWVQNASFPVVRTDMLQYRNSDNTILAATHGRGLWSATISPEAPYIRFLSSYTFSPLNYMTTTASGNTCRNYKDYTLNMHIDVAPTGNAIVNLTVASGATAIRGIDFDFTTDSSFTSPSSSFNFANGASTDKVITIRVYNQAKIGNSTSFTLNYTISGSNALPAPSCAAYTFNIGNNNIAPVSATYNGSYTPAAPNVTIQQESPFRGDLSKFRIQYLFTAAELNAAGISGSGNITSLGINVTTQRSLNPYNGFSISMGNTTATTMGSGFPGIGLTQVYSSNYTTVAGNNIFDFSTPFAWDGSSNVIVNMCFDNGSTTSSVDDVNGVSAPLGSNYGSAWSDISASSGCSTPASYAYYPRIATVFTASNGIVIDSVLNDSRQEFVGDSGQYYIYNGVNVINSLNNTSANLGCVNTTIVTAGSTWTSFSSGKASQKLIQITPSTNSTASYTVGLYYTSVELSGKIPAGLKIAKTSAATVAAATGSNTVTSTTTATAFGSGYLFTANFTGFSKFFLVDSNVVLPVELVFFNGMLNNQLHGQLQWRTVNQYNVKNFEVQRSYDGIHYISIGTVDAVQKPGIVLDYTFIDPTLANSINYYRLKTVDEDGRYKLSEILTITNGRIPGFVSLLENPVKGNIAFVINNSDQQQITAQLYNSAGQLVESWDLGKINGTVNLPFKNTKPAASVYTLKISSVTKTANFKISIIN